MGISPNNYSDYSAITNLPQVVKLEMRFWRTISKKIATSACGVLTMTGKS
jgi:hypothetical protein